MSSVANSSSLLFQVALCTGPPFEPVKHSGASCWSGEGMELNPFLLFQGCSRFSLLLCLNFFLFCNLQPNFIHGHLIFIVSFASCGS